MKRYFNVHKNAPGVLRKQHDQYRGKLCRIGHGQGKDLYELDLEEPEWQTIHQHEFGEAIEKQFKIGDRIDYINRNYMITSEEPVEINGLWSFKYMLKDQSNHIEIEVYEGQLKNLS